MLFTAVFRLLAVGQDVRELWPGILTAALLWEVLQVVGGIYVGHVVRGASTTYGTFATVIGLLTWLFLGARVLVYSAELNSVLTAGSGRDRCSIPQMPDRPSQRFISGADGQLSIRTDQSKGAIVVGIIITVLVAALVYALCVALGLPSIIAIVAGHPRAAVRFPHGHLRITKPGLTGRDRSA